MEDIVCLSCNAVLTEILASHDYTIERNSETNQWVKSEGDVTYRCSNCMEVLEIDDIGGVLKQVDEL